MEKYLNITMKDALEKYSKGNSSICCLRPSSNGRQVMWTMDEIFDGAIFFEVQSDSQEINISNQEIHQLVEDSHLEANGDVTAEGDSILSNKRIRIDLGKMKALKVAGWSKREVAEELKCSMPSVNKYWNKI